jgi:branched-subunit amino acid ABC-type transport system permease component
LAMGIVLVYRATRVINFAVGNMGLVGSALFVLLVVQYNVPYWLGVLIGLGVGTLFGIIVELTVIRRLFTSPRVIVLVATIGVAQLSQVVLSAYPKIEVSGARFPTAIGATYTVAAVRVTGPQISILLVVPVIAIALAWFLNRTIFGKSVKASAENPDLARLAGVSPKRVSLFVWAVAGALSTLSISLMAAQSGSASDLATLGPSTRRRGARRHGVVSPRIRSRRRHRHPAGSDRFQLLRPDGSDRLPHPRRGPRRGVLPEPQQIWR